MDPLLTALLAYTSDDKRRRNTAASARFRIKKKQRSLNLQRTVSDLTGRAAELEREAADLRRENGWLKEIVLLKGRAIPAFAAAPSFASPPDRDPDPDNDHDTPVPG